MIEPTAALADVFARSFNVSDSHGVLRVLFAIFDRPELAFLRPVSQDRTKYERFAQPLQVHLGFNQPAGPAQRAGRNIFSNSVATNDEPIVPAPTC